MKAEKLDQEIIEALEERGHSLEDIELMDGSLAFDEFCEWHGLPGWGSTLRRVMESIKEAL